MFHVLKIAVAGSLVVLHSVTSGVTRRVIDTKIQVVEGSTALIVTAGPPSHLFWVSCSSGCLNARAQLLGCRLDLTHSREKLVLANTHNHTITGAPCLLKPPDSFVWVFELSR